MLAALPGTSGQYVAHPLIARVFSTFGVQETFRNDRGSKFEEQLVKELQSVLD